MSRQNEENHKTFNEVIYVVERATDQVTGIVHRSSNGNFAAMRGMIIPTRNNTVKIMTENSKVAQFSRSGVASYEAKDAEHWQYPKRVQIS